MKTRQLVSREFPLLGLSGMLIVALVLLGAHHVVQLPSSPLQLDHLGALCLIALHELLSPVHYGFHAVLFIGVSYATWDRGRALRQSRSILRVLDSSTVALPERVVEAAALARVQPARIRLVAGLPVPAFTAGWLQPRVYLAAEIADALSEAELTGVLAHEGHHIQQRDPLRLFLIRFLGAVLFWLPVGRTLARMAADRSELAADDAAANLVGRTTLASALIRSAQRFTRPAPAWSAPIHGWNSIEHRVRRLLGNADSPSRISYGSRATILAANVLLLAGMSGVLMTHPLSENRNHCRHGSGSPIAHLVCRYAETRAGAECPHANVSARQPQTHH